ncbi:MAG TPA: sugar phosphate isomerase/epimerase family protein [Candidatus Acidoferrales bacterium]
MIRIAILAFGIALLLAIPAAQKTRTVRIGYCGGISDIDAVRAAGFDYIELRTAEIANLSDADYNRLVERMKANGFPVPTAYQFILGKMKITGPDINKDEQMAYFREALDRVAKLGARTVVVGSGTARQYPEGFSNEEAFRQLVDFFKRLAPEARGRNIVIAIEPLRRGESNIINSMGEGLQLVEAVGDPNIQLNLDFYHLESEKEDPAIILKAASHIAHVHMANPTGRVFPLKWDEYNYAPFFENLRKIGYDKEISVEASTKDFPNEAPRAIAFLRNAMAGAR